MKKIKTALYLNMRLHFLHLVAQRLDLSLLGGQLVGPRMAVLLLPLGNHRAAQHVSSEHAKRPAGQGDYHPSTINGPIHGVLTAVLTLGSGGG